MTRFCVLVVCLLAMEAQAPAATRGRGEVGSRVQKPRISAMSKHNCAVLDDGTVRCWGANGSGQLGNGTIATTQSLPVQATGVGGVVAVAAGVNHTCVLVVSGTVKCW